jgi:cytochrome P450
MSKVIDRDVDPSTGWTNEIDLQPLFFNLTLDTATQFLFGESADSQLTLLGQVKPGRIDFAKEFDLSQRLVARASRFGDLWWLGHTKELRDSAKLVHEYVDHYVQLALEQPAEKQDIDERYIFLRALAQETRNPIELRAQLLNILLAGRDTTASLLGWLFFLLGDPQYAHITKKLRGIILEEFGTFSQPRNITFETLKSCQYLQWVLNETLRLYPVVPLNTRRAEVDTTLPVGGGLDGKSRVYVRKGAQVSYSVSLPFHYSYI